MQCNFVWKDQTRALMFHQAVTNIRLCFGPRPDRVTQSCGYLPDEQFADEETQHKEELEKVYYEIVHSGVV